MSGTCPCCGQPVGGNVPGALVTKRQRELLDFIASFTAEHRFPPSQQQMADHLGLLSKSGVNRLLTSLEERGYIRRLAHRARAIEIVGPA